jgi:hypothetical protein
VVGVIVFLVLSGFGIYVLIKTSRDAQAYFHAPSAPPQQDKKKKK